MTRQSALLLLLLTALLLACDAKKEEKTARKERVFQVRTQPVKSGEHYLKFRTSGFFEPVHSLRVRPEVSGRVERFYVEEGDRVREGEPLLKIEDSLYRAAYEETLWKLRQSERELANVRAVYERRKKLFEKELISKEEFEESKTKLESLSAQVESLRALLERKGLELEKTTLRSPIDGYVLRRFVEKGDYVTPQRDTYEVVKTSPLRLVFSVPQEVVKVLRKGSEVKVVADGRSFRAEVSYISPSADKNRLFTVKALLRNEGEAIRPNSYAEVSFNHRKVRAVSLPEQAVQLSQRQSFVWVVRDSRAAKLPVEVLAHEEGKVLVRGDFKEGDRVVVEGLLFLYEGAKVSER
ncbi:cation efflux system (czcB-like) protein [Hydrogenivirga sp. 128-5-R1-1]|nr:cation efflux system (czcB-like) protein [Hydrogenivirga sp. 128-5-R1-1]